jgi:hypothetical protein
MSESGPTRPTVIRRTTGITVTPVPKVPTVTKELALVGALPKQSAGKTEKKKPELNYGPRCNACNIRHVGGCW